MIPILHEETDTERLSDHRAVKQQNWVSNPGYQAPESVLKTLLIGYDLGPGLSTQKEEWARREAHARSPGCTEGMIKVANRPSPRPKSHTTQIGSRVLGTWLQSEHYL